MQHSMADFRILREDAAAGHLVRARDLLGCGAVLSELGEDALGVVEGAGVVERGGAFREVVDDLRGGEVGSCGIGAMLEKEAGDCLVIVVYGEHQGCVPKVRDRIDLGASLK